jgi:large subunit ribosomal protein L22
MGKPKRERSLAENEARAVTRNLRVSPRKLDLVAGLIRGKKVDAALADLEFSRKRIAQDVKKCVMSAVANAENNHGLDVNDLVVSQAWVGKNLVMKRFAARGRGRASSITKPFSQITVIVRQTDEEGGERTKKSKAGAKSGAKAGGKSDAKSDAKTAAGKSAKGSDKGAKAKAGSAPKDAKPEAKSKSSAKPGKSGKETE